MKICITGATGFVGAHLVRYFSAQGHEILALGRQKTPPPALLNYAKWQQADLLQPILSIECDICIHAAGMAADKGSELAFYKTNVLGTQHVFEAVKASIFIHISSASVYPFLQRPLKEDDAILTSNLSFYGASKLKAEHYLAENAGNKKSITVLRPRAIYGTQDRVLLPRILDLVKFGKILLPGTADVQVSMTHIGNLIHAVELAMTDQLADYQVFNVADTQPYHLRTILEKVIFGAFQKELPVWNLPLNGLKKFVSILEKMDFPTKLSTQSLDYISQSFELDLTKIKKELGYQEQRNFETEQSDLMAWVHQIGVETIVNKKVNLAWSEKLAPPLL